MADILGTSLDLLLLFFFISLLVIFFYGQNFQGWHAKKQVVHALQQIDDWRTYGITLIKNVIEPFSPTSITDREIIAFIRNMLSFFVLNPSDLDPPLYYKRHYLISRRRQRFEQLIRDFLPSLDEKGLSKIIALFHATTEIENIYKKVQHDLIIGEKTKSTWFILQTAANITQHLLKAKAYRTALDSFCSQLPIGDSVGTLALKTFVDECVSRDGIPYPDFYPLCFKIGYFQINYQNRNCICVRTEGPECNIGSPGDAFEILIKNLQTKNITPKLIVTIDACSRLEGEKTGTVAQGLGVAVGGELNNENLDKFRIESIIMDQSIPIPLEAIVCRENLEDAVSPMTEDIELAIPKIIRILKQIIRTQSKSNETIIIMGIGNAIGVPMKN